MKDKLVEVCRSFSYKLNVGNYESRDFFCSQKSEVSEKDAEKASESLYEFCKNEVIKSVNRYKLENTPTNPAEKEAKLNLEHQIEGDNKGKLEF